MKSKQKTEDWEKELPDVLRTILPYWESEDKDDYMYVVTINDLPKIIKGLKSFISNLLEKEKNRWKKITLEEYILGITERLASERRRIIDEVEKINLLETDLQDIIKIVKDGK